MGCQEEFLHAKGGTGCPGHCWSPRPGAIKEMRGLGAKGRGFVVGLVVLADAWT